MTNSLRSSILNLQGDEEDLRQLLEKYLERAEELENRENKVLKQIELMQTAVSSLQDWNESRKASRSSSEPVLLDLNAIEEETRMIREETERIQQEIQAKIEENKALEEEVRRRKSQQHDAIMLETRKVIERKPPVRDTQQETDYFAGKLKKLKQMEQQMVKESDLRSGELKKKQQDLRDKVDMLEWESRIDKQLIENLRKKNKKN